MPLTPAEEKLHDAVRSGDAAEVSRLLAMDVDVNASDDYGRTALHYVLTRGTIPIVIMLLKHGANPDQDDIDGSIALHLAIGCKQNAIVEILCRVTKHIDFRNQNGLTPLHLAARRGSVAMLDCLLKSGANPREMDGNGRAALFHALSYTKRAAFQYEMVKSLLLQNADPMEVYPDGSTPLHYAAFEKTVGLLLDSGASISATNNWGEMPLDTLFEWLRARSSSPVPLEEVNDHLYDVALQIIACRFLRNGAGINRDFTRYRLATLLTKHPTVLENAVVVGARFRIGYQLPESAIKTPAEFFARTWTDLQYLRFMDMTEKACQSDPENRALAEFRDALHAKMQTRSLRLAAVMVAADTPALCRPIAEDMVHLYRTGQMRGGSSCPKDMYPLLFAHPKIQQEVKRLKTERVLGAAYDSAGAGADPVLPRSR